jgi:hypothetical protein
VTKPFSPDLYRTNDDAKHLVIEWLDGQGYTAHVNPDQYGIDLLASHKTTSRRIEVEVEVKHNWSGAVFPFASVHFPARKLKFANDHSFFMMLNAERSHLLVVSGTQLLAATKINKATVYTRTETFVEVPTIKCSIFSLDAV